jgi:predicted metal-dependent phosphotriesterase family hydrolase
LGARTGVFRTRNPKSFSAVFSVADVANNIRKVVLSTDMGQIGLAAPPDGMSAYIAELKAQGISQRDLDRMSKENPARLLGLPVN